METQQHGENKKQHGIWGQARAETAAQRAGELYYRLLQELSSVQNVMVEKKKKDKKRNNL